MKFVNVITYYVVLGSILGMLVRNIGSLFQKEREKETKAQKSEKRF